MDNQDKQEKRKTLTVHMSKDVLKKLKIFCAKNDVKMKDHVEMLIVESLK